MMASGSNNKRFGSSSLKAPVVRRNSGPPWLTIAAVAIVVLLAGSITWVVIDKSSTRSAKADALEPFLPTAENRDPSTAIPGIYVGAVSDVGADKPFNYPGYKALLHVTADQRVGYDRFPPVGGPHDGQWADCLGIVYDVPVRDENMVHTLEHGAIWIAYNPDMVQGADLETLKGLVNGQSFITLAPYPGLAKAISLQAWAHQLQVDTASDPRIEQFITALRQNQYVYPETGARCDSPGWDSANPPAFDASPRTATDVRMDGSGATPASGEIGGSGEVVPSGAEIVPSGSEDVPAGTEAVPSGSDAGTSGARTSARTSPASATSGAATESSDG